MHLLERIAIWLAGFSVFAAMLIIVAEIVFRLFGSFIPGSIEIISYYLIVGIAYLPLGKVERRREMISMDVFSVIAGRRVNAAMDWSNGLASVLVYALLTAASWQFAMSKFAIGTYVNTSTFALITWPGHFIPPVAFGLTALIVLLRLFGLSQGDAPEDPASAER